MPKSRLSSIVLLLALLVPPRTVGAEEVVETGEDGTVVSRYDVDEQGRKHGSYERFHPNGRRAVKATYKAGKRNGTEKTWNEEGVLRTAHGYKNDVLHGAHKAYDQKGHVQVQRTYRDGVLHGSFKSYHTKGQLKVVTSYRSGQLHGKYHERTRTGATRLLTTYDRGRVHGKYDVFDGGKRSSRQVWEHGRPVTIDGLIPFPRTKDAIGKELTRLLAGSGELPSAELDADRELAVRQLKAYRYLVGVPYDDIVLDKRCNDYAQAGSEICAAIGKMTHKPTNPGWPADRFAFAALGAERSNLHQQQRACTSVRGYMDDSDPTNIAKLGHRCWCLNPPLRKTGFGHAQGYTAMWATDESRAKVPDAPFTAVPPPGHVPGPWFGPRWAWSVTPHPKHFDAPVQGKVEAIIEPIGADFLPNGEPLKLDYEKVKTDGLAMPYLVIFRPESLSLDAGARYRVTLRGLTHKGKPKPVRYYVEFFDLEYVTPSVTRGAR